MAEVKNGFLISARKKVGGTVLYRSKGEQLMRGAPVYPAGYVGSDAQIQVRDLFGDVSGHVSKYRSLTPVLNSFETVIGRRYKGTYRDQWVGRAFGNLFRAPDGSPRSAGEQSELIEFMDTAPGAWMLRNIRPPHFRQHPIFGADAQFSSNGTGGITCSVTFPQDYLQAALMALQRRGFSRVKLTAINGIAWGTPYGDAGPIGEQSGYELKSASTSSTSPRMLFGQKAVTTNETVKGCLAVVIYATTTGTLEESGYSLPPTYIPMESFFFEDERLFF